jgi:hypothetical protein
MPVRTADPERIPAGPWLHFHWEAFTLPPGGDELARTPAGVAAFAHGRHLGTQFHPEATPEIVDEWTRAEPRLTALGVDPGALLADGRGAADAARTSAFRLFDSWAAPRCDRVASRACGPPCSSPASTTRCFRGWGGPW